MSYYSLFNVLHKEKKAQPSHSSYAQTSVCNGADGGSWTRDLILTKDALYHWATLATKIFWSGKRDSNPRPPAWKASALSTELFPRNPKHSSVSARGLVSASNCEVPKDPCKISATQFFALIKVWVRMDSNHRSWKAADLQSAPFGHSGTHPKRIMN